MSEKNRAATVARHLEKSRENNEYATPYDLISSNLRTQNSKARATAVDLLVREFSLHPFDAETVARSAADLSQLKDATRTPHSRRYGQYEISFIEVDVVTWRILPSLENIRFEGERAWKSGHALRYGTPINAQPVLGLKHSDPDFVLRTLRAQTKTIWEKNPHSRSIPMRGIETPGLLSIARLSLGDNEKIGVLDATDGFSRTVGAQRGSGIDIDEVLFDLQRDATENKLRNELISLRDSGEAALESEAGEVAAARLRSSIMPRAQIIVGYRKIGLGSGDSQPPFDEVRRSLVGHIHLEPPLPFADSTENALKARIALEAVHTENMMPPVAGLSAEKVLSLLKSEIDEGAPTTGDTLIGGLHADEVLLLSQEALISPLDQKRTRVVNAAIHSLTGKKPQKPERSALAADTAMRVNRIALGQDLDPAFKGRRSTMQRVLAAPTLKHARLTRRPILEIRDAALSKLREQRDNFEDVGKEVSADAAELGVLGLYGLVEGVMSLKDGEARPLLIRSNTRINGEYMPEPQQIIEKMVTTETGLQQLAQVVLDVRGSRAPRRLIDGEIAGTDSTEDWKLLDTDDLYRYKTNWTGSHIDPSSDPHVARDLYRRQLVEGTASLKAIADHLKRIELPDGSNLIEKEGLALENEEWTILDDLAFELKTWNRTADRVAPTVAPHVEENDDEDEYDEEFLDDEDVA
ncbi:hypothetical protein Q2T94_07560 [Paeniglutamicibacter sulfureus]|uniref:hypothetical protein n=1 Tax=Paeniglutamicibacter sulfureus TaxID=43666 RepID=UPI002666999F|nr:hypothetical protein [Paeniglutamicibacter sulfureus]MDO2934151.1 hypothetical protein [Paeniglutamicibacter sulfureus]